MTTRQFQTIFFSILGLCILVIVLSYVLFDFIEVETATIWTMKYFALPILIVTTPTCYFIYLKFIRQHEKKKYRLKIWAQLRTIFRIFILTLAMTGIFIATTLSLIVLTNAFIGDSKTININAKVIDYYTLTSKGRTTHYIKIKDAKLDRLIELEVEGQYEVGQTFKKTLRIGKWGLLYAKK